MVKRTPLHGPATTSWTDQQVDSGEGEEQVTPRGLGFGNRGLGQGSVVGGRETTPSSLKLGVDVGGGKKTVVADLDESGRQDVQKESAHEFHGVHGRGLAVFGAKADVVSIEAHQPLIGHPDPVGVPTEVLEDLLGAPKGLLGVDDPVLAVKAVLEPVEGRTIGKLGAAACKGEPITLVEIFEAVEDLATEDLGHRLDGKEEPAACWYPMLLLVETSGRDDAMGVGMEAQVARPGVQHTGHSKLRMQAAETKVEQGSRGRFEQQVVHFGGIHPSQRAQFLGQGEDHMEILRGNDSLAALFDPSCLGQGLALGTVAIAARIVGGPFVSARRADVQMPAQLGGPALLDGSDDFALFRRRRVLVTKGPAGGAEDVSHFQTGPPLPRLGSTRLDDHRALPGRRGFFRLREPVERAGDLLEVPGADLCVMGRGLKIRMPEQSLNHSDIGPVFKKVCGESVAKRVQGHALLEAQFSHYRLQRATNDVDVHGAPVSAWKQVRTSRSTLCPVSTKRHQQVRA